MNFVITLIKKLINLKLTEAGLQPGNGKIIHEKSGDMGLH